MSDSSATAIVLCIAALAVICVATIKHEHPDCVRFGGVVEIVGDCGMR